MTPDVRPRFRTDLVAEPIQDDGTRFIDVFDPDSGTGFRFYEIEYALACAMDGERDVAGLVRWAREELGVEPSPRELATVISTLGDLGYLAGTPGADVGDLAAGVVAGPPVAPPQVEDVELGTAGAVAATASATDLPPMDVELGQAGGVSAPRMVVDDFGTGPELGPSGRDDFPPPPVAAIPTAQLRPTTMPDSDHDGPTDLPRPVPLAAGDDDVSTDLSDHLAISASDVKEAVRASKVMSAVEMPADIAATLAAAEAEQEAKAAAAKAAATAERAAAEEQAAAEAKAAAEAAALAEREAAEKAAAAQAAADRAAQAVVKPAETAASKLAAAAAATKAAETKAAETKAAATATAKLPPPKTTTTTAKPVEPPEEPRTSRALIALLVLTILLAGAYLVWTQLLKKPLPWEKDATATAAQPPAPPPRPPAPPPPPPPSATLLEVPGATTDVAAGRQGVIAEIVADGSTVAAGEGLARFVAPVGLTKELAAGKKRLDVELPRLIAEATAKRDTAVVGGKADLIKIRQEQLDKLLAARSTLEGKLASISTQLEPFAVKAPLAGTVKTQVAKAAKIVKDEQVIASITGTTTLTAQFTPNPGTSYSAGQPVRVAVKASPSEAIACAVKTVDGNAVTVECPAATGLVAGTEIILK